MSHLYYPLHSLKEGNWFKLICGASFQDLPAIRSLALAYTLAGADCIDVGADRAVITAAKEGIAAARILEREAKAKGFTYKGSPWLMVSLNDGEDPHFRKAEFDSTQCPSDCPRPCETICPADAIAFWEMDKLGVLDSRCYGCGRCLPVCPSQLIVTRSYVSTPNAIASLLQDLEIDAIEIHTKVEHREDFPRLWKAIAPWCDRLKLLAISCPDHPELIDYLHYLYELISPLPCPLIWQTDGRPMSGDIGKGTTKAAIGLAQKVLDARLPGYVQLAGGTNFHTVSKLRSMGLLGTFGVQNPSPSQNVDLLQKSKNLIPIKGKPSLEKRVRVKGEKIDENFFPFPLPLSPLPPSFPPYQGGMKGGSKSPSPTSARSQVSGVAYGSYARTLLAPILDRLETSRLEDSPELLWQAVTQADSLVSQLKPTAKEFLQSSS
ncbi:MAG: 4Fe-4S ferredoxin [Hydrococcus sp. RU_2_2]|nr:4Fe-4S ferredoxin [Hydrococcus sp. RU_2_2]